MIPEEILEFLVITLPVWWYRCVKILVTTIYRAAAPISNILIFIAQILVVLSFSVIVPFYVKSASSADIEYPLNFLFTTCPDQLSGICSFLEARLDLHEEDFKFAINTPYSLSLDLELYADDEENRSLGSFIVDAVVRDAEGRILRSYVRSTRSAKRKTNPSWSASAIQTLRNAVFFPLDLIGYFDPAETYHINVGFTKSFIDRATLPATSITIQIQNRLLQIHSAKLVISAHLSLLHDFLLRWPVCSHIAFSAAIFLPSIYALLIVKFLYYFLFTRRLLTWSSIIYGMLYCWEQIFDVIAVTLEISRD